MLKTRQFTSALTEKARQSLIIVFITLIVSGCSTTSLIYNNADWLLESRMDSYFDLSDSQTDDLSTRLTQLHQWHRHEELPRYAQMLNKLSAQAQDGLNVAEIEASGDDIETARQALVMGIIPDLAEFLSGLSDEQIAHYDQAFREEMEEEQDLANGPLADRQDELAEELIDRLQHWTGPLDFDQRKLIAERFESLPDYQPLWLTFRLQRHGELIELLNRQPDAKQIQQRLEAWWRDREAAYPKDYRKSRESSLYELTKLLADLDQTLTQEQRQYLIDQLTRYSYDFLLLSEESV